MIVQCKINFGPTYDLALFDGDDKQQLLDILSNNGLSDDRFWIADTAWDFINEQYMYGQQYVTDSVRNFMREVYLVSCALNKCVWYI